MDPEFLPTVLTSPAPTEDARFGQSVAASGPFVAVGAPYELESILGVVHEGQVYVQDTANGASTLLASPASSVDPGGFGWALAMSGDLLVVGAPFQNGGAGAAYVYSITSVSNPAINGGQPFLATSLVDSLSSPNAVNVSVYGSAFGSAVAISGSLVVVGAYEENASGYAAAGHAYVFNLQTGSTVMLSSPLLQEGGYFGYSVAVSGNRVLVGAPNQKNGADAVIGFVYLFAASTGDLITTLDDPSPYPGSGFGAVVAINLTTAVVSVPGPQPSYLGGVVFEFNLISGTNATLVSPNPIEGGEFGFALAIDSSTIVVGAPNEPSGGSTLAGNAYLFSVASGALITSSFAPPDWPQGAAFGQAVAENGGVDVVVGAPGETADNLAAAGHAFVFDQIPLAYANPEPDYGPFAYAVSVNSGVAVVGFSGATVSGKDAAGEALVMTSFAGPIVTLKSPDPQPFASFGYSVANWGDTVLVAAYEGTDPDQYSGQAYLFNGSSGALLANLTSHSPAVDGLFGDSVAMDGTYVAIGATGEGYGDVQVFYTSNGTYLATAHNPLSEHDGFGSAVSLSGDTLAVGAGGVAYVFCASNGTRNETLVSPSGPTATFGTSISISGATVAVGTPGMTAAGLRDAGAVYTYSATTGALLLNITSPNPVQSGLFGQSVSSNSGTIVVGAPFETAFGVSEAGNVYLVNPATGAVKDRYNSPSPLFSGQFGFAVSIAPGGAIIVGSYANLAYLFFL